MKVWIRRLGAGTEEIYQNLKAGHEIWVTAPLGSGLVKKINSYSNVLFLSGGVGGASILPIQEKRRLQSQYKDIWVHGERDSQSLDKNLKIDHLYFEKSENKNDVAKVGRITDFLTQPNWQSGFSAAVACGPSAMLEGIDKIWEQQNVKIPLFLGLEEKMACGMGLCFSCSVKTNVGMARCCLEGPWFERKELKDHWKFRKGLAP